MQKNDKRTPEEIARDLEEIVLPEVSEDDLEQAFGGISQGEISNFTNCTGC
ncbi:MAG TPA: hypothetical protein VFR03_10785 [Thermoanaerobaculia bacterium]|nr:hypothetical protein [Thermoanaerobaculia bacterium]